MTATVLDTILEKRFFGPWREGPSQDPKSIWADSNLELFVTGSCNQNCEYCYLVRHDELFPHNMRNPETIKTNLRIFLDWCLEQNFTFNQVDLFSGEVWQGQFGWDILDIIFEYLQKGLSIRTLMIPTNASFVLSDKALIEMSSRIEKFNQIGCFFQLSGSIDGGFVDTVTRQGNTPSLTERKNSEDFYDRFFSFWRRYHYRFHPMVSYENVKYWKENFRWWEEKCIEYGYDAFDDIMMLEVRNDGWTEESIKDYQDYLNFLIDKILKERFNNDPARLANHLFLTDIFNGTGSGYINFGLTPADSFQGCTMSDMFTVRLGDLAIPPCHRTAYDNLLYGKFKVEDNKIVGIEERNSQIASRLLLQDSILCSPGCDCCPYNYFCMRGCYGSQQETENDPFMPIESVCNMFRGKLDFLIDKYEEIGVFDALRKIPATNTRYEAIQNSLNAIERIKEARKR